MVRLFSFLRPIDHKPEFFQFPVCFLKPASQKDLLPSDAGAMSLTTSGRSRAILPGSCGQRARYIHKVPSASGELLIGWRLVFHFEHGGHLLGPANMLVRSLFQERL